MTTPKCLLCGHESHYLGPHLDRGHGMSLQEYLEEHPGAPTLSEEVLNRVAFKGVRTSRTLDKLSVTFGGVQFPVYHQVPESACLPPSEHHTVPTKGTALTAASRLGRHLFFNRHTIVWGPSGSGKDAFLSTWSWACRRPGAVFQVRPEANIEGWLRQREISPELGSHYKDGLFLKLYRDGYEVKNEDGEITERIPCVLLITDLDRATEEQMETFRLIMDSTSGRFVDPEGITHYMLPGTLIVATSNTIGGGDDTGLYRSARPQDASLMSRWQRSIRWHYLEWEDEVQLCRKKFPGLVARTPQMLGQLKTITTILRAAIANRQVQTVFGHREVHYILEDAWDIVRLNDGKIPQHLLRDALLGVIEKARDEANIKAMKDLIDAHVAGDLYSF